jgi:hypothetical protein
MDKVKDALERIEEKYGKKHCIYAMKEVLKELSLLGIKPKHHEKFEDEFLVAVQRFIGKYPDIGEKFIVYALLSRLVRL